MPSTAPNPPRSVPPSDQIPGRAPTLFQQFKKRRFFSCLDGLRALSILGVIWHHSAAPSFGEGVPLVHEGNRGVNLFFVISAFLISTLLLRAKEDGVLHVPRFWARRALRILPLYYAMLVLYAVLVVGFEHDAAARAGFIQHLRYYATFTSNWFVQLDSPRVIFYFAWSLAAEEQFYLCWPWIERALSRMWPAAVAVGALIITQLAGVMYQRTAETSLPLKIMASVPAAILLGVVLAHVLHTERGFAWIARFAGRRGSALVAGALALGVLAIEPRLGFGGELVVAVALTLLVATCVIREDNDLAGFLRLRPVAWVGLISYGIYLLNMLCIGVGRSLLSRAHHPDSPLLLFVVGTVLSIAAASLSYVTYERYFLRLKERWFGDKKRARGEGGGVLASPGLAIATPLTAGVAAAVVTAAAAAPVAAAPVVNRTAN